MRSFWLRRSHISCSKLTKVTVLIKIVRVFSPFNSHMSKWPTKKSRIHRHTNRERGLWPIIASVSRAGWPVESVLSLSRTMTELQVRALTPLTARGEMANFARCAQEKVLKVPQVDSSSVMLWKCSSGWFLSGEAAARISDFSKAARKALGCRGGCGLRRLDWNDQEWCVGPD